MSSQYKHIQLRRAERRDLEKANPTLRSGEPAFSIDNHQLKIGNGTDSWNNLHEFISTYKFRSESVTLNLPAITNNGSYTASVTVDNIKTDNEYAIIATPENALPDYIDIHYAYVSGTNQVSIKFINTDSSSVDGNGLSTHTSVSANNVVIYLLVYLVNEPLPPEVTTTTLPPVIDDIFSFGYNEFGQLSLGDKENRNTPTFVSDNKKWTDFSLGHYHGLGISLDKELYSVGYNYYGQLGLETDGVGENKNVLTKTGANYFKNGNVYNSNPKWSKVAAGAQHSLAVDSSGHLFSFGDGSYGSLGTNNLVIQNKPTLVGEEYHFVDLLRLTNAGLQGSVFTLNDVVGDYRFTADSGVYIVSGIPQGSAVAIEHNGEMGTLRYSGGLLESQVNGYNYYSDYLSIDVSGNYGTASLRTLGGYLDNGLDILYYDNPNDGWTDISAGNAHSLGIKDGSLYAWGNNSFGQLGNADHRNLNLPNIISNKSDWVAVEAGNYHSLALDASGDVYVFGNNTYGQLGIGTSSHQHSPKKVEFDFSKISDVNFTNLPSGSFINVDTYNGAPVYNLDYTLNKAYNPLERFVLDSGTYIINDVPQSHPIAILNKGKESAITYNGDNKFGCLSLLNTTADGQYNFYYGNVYINVKDNFDKVSIYSYADGYMGGKNLLFYMHPDYKITDIDAGLNHSILMTDSDQVLTFGQNHKGQLGTGDNIDRSSPFRLNESNIDRIAAGGHQTFLVDQAKYIWAFGDNHYGQLGLSDNVDRSIPSRIQSSIKWQNIYSGGGHSFATVFNYFAGVPSDFISENGNQNALVGNRQILLSWNHITALEEGVTKYIVEYSTDNGSTWTVHDNNALSMTQQTEGLFYIVDGLSNSSSYLFRIAAFNNNGQGAYAETSQPVSPVEATDGNFDEVALYSHLDNGNIADLSDNNYSYQDKFVTNAPRYPDSRLGEALRLYHYDALEYTTNFTLPEEYTVEFFFRPRGATAGEPILALKNSSDTFLNITYRGQENSGYIIDIYDSGNTRILSSENVAPLNNNFYHLAVVRTSGSINNPNDNELAKLYLNGALVSSGVSDGTYDVDFVTLASGVNFYDFDIDELRIGSGVRYINNFTPTTKPFGIGLP